jgi:tetratricopeptide (TPR) repeat protein
MTAEYVPPEEFDAVKFFVRSGIAWGAVDLFVHGRGRSVLRAGKFAAVLAALHQDGHPAVKEIVVVWPPRGDITTISVKVKSRIASTLTSIAGGPITPTILDEVIARVSVVNTTSLEFESLVALIGGAEPNSALIVVKAACYRTSEPIPNPNQESPAQDRWVPHMYALLTQVVAAAAANDCYVVVDADEDPPTRIEYEGLLLSIDACGVSIGSESSSPSLDHAEVQSWSALALCGHLGDALTAVELRDGLGASDKTVHKVRLLLTAGYLEVAKSVFTADSSLIEIRNAEGALQVAILAHQVGADETASRLLIGAVGELDNRELLEAALALSGELDIPSLTEAAESALAELFPSSAPLRRWRANTLARSGDYEAAAALLEREKERESVQLRVLFELFARYLERGDSDCSDFLAAIRARSPEQSERAQLMCAGKLEEVGERGEALRGLLLHSAESGLSQRLGIGSISLARRALLARDEAVDHEAITRIVEAVVRGLSRRPQDAVTRVALLELFAPQSLGVSGTPILAAVMLSLAAREVNVRETALPLENGDDVTIERLTGIVARGLQSLGMSGTLTLGGTVYPAAQLDAPPDAVLSTFERYLSYVAARVNDRDDLRALHLSLAVAMSIVPLGSRPDRDLELLQLVANKLGQAGHLQAGRDLAEQILISSGTEPRRQRIAWFGFADVYARMGNTNKALIAMACAQAVDGSITWEQVWYESTLLLRLMRELGLTSMNNSLLRAARQALEHIGFERRTTERLRTIELQLKWVEHVRGEGEDVPTLQWFAEHTTSLVARVLEAGDELAPSAMLLASVVQRAAAVGELVHQDAVRTLDAALERLDPQARSLVMMERTDSPEVGQLVAYVRALEAARYAEDIGYDMRSLAHIARRVLRSVGSKSGIAAIYAIELLADHALLLPEGPDGPARHERIVDTKSGPASAATALARAGLSVVILGLADDNLLRVTVTDGVIASPVVEPSSVFSASALREWSTQYPYGYATSEEANVFFTSTKELGLSGLPERAIVVSSTEVQSFPPNLFQVDGDLAGREHRLAIAPSLTWLLRATAFSFRGDGRTVAWIPTGSPGDGLSTLNVLADRLSGTFQKFSVDLAVGPRCPASFAGADLAIIAAHGGIADGGRFFRVVRDDEDLAMSPSALSEDLRGVGVVVLFVCSSGRLDKHPDSRAMVGIMREMLDAGARAVIGPPWPLKVSVPPYWLPVFLEAWCDGKPVIDACFEANQAVQGRLGADPSSSLAMTVYGDPLACRAV